MKRSPGRPWIVALVLGGVAVLVRLPLLDIPFERDDASYALLGTGLLEGRLPYRDFVTLKPPLLYALYLPLGLVGGGDPVRQRLAGMVFPVAAALALWGLGRALFGPRAAFFAALIYALISADPRAHGCFQNAETLMIPFAILSVWYWWASTRKGERLSAAWAGAWLGVAALVKHSVIPQAVLLASVPSRRLAARLVPPFVAGFAVIIALAAAVLAATGSVPALAEAARESARYMDVEFRARIPFYAASALRLAQSQGAFWLLAILGAVAGTRARGAGRLLGLWLAGSVAGVFLGGRGFPHYYQQLLPPVALLAGAGLERVLRRPRPLFFPAWLVALAAASLPALAGLAPFTEGGREARARLLFPRDPFVQAEQAARWLAEHTPEGSAVFVAGTEPELALLSRRRLAGRYPFIYHLTVDAPDTVARQASWLGELEDPGVAAAVYCDQAGSWYDLYSSPVRTEELKKRAYARLSGPGWRAAASFPPFAIYLRQEGSR